MNDDWYEQVEILTADLESWWCRNRWLKVSRLTRLVDEGRTALLGGMPESNFPKGFRLSAFVGTAEKVLGYKRNQFPHLRG